MPRMPVFTVQKALNEVRKQFPVEGGLPLWFVVYDQQGKPLGGTAREYFKKHGLKGGMAIAKLPDARVRFELFQPLLTVSVLADGSITKE